MPLSQPAKKGITVLGGVTDADYQGGLGLPPHYGGKKGYVYRAGDPLGHVLVLRCPVIKSMLQQPGPGSMTKGTYM